VASVTSEGAAGTDRGAVTRRLRCSGPGARARPGGSSGAIALTASWAAKIVLFLGSIGFAAGSFRVPANSGSCGLRPPVSSMVLEGMR
jgi:hypothetical protein